MTGRLPLLFALLSLGCSVAEPAGLNVEMYVPPPPGEGQGVAVVLVSSTETFDPIWSGDRQRLEFDLDAEDARACNVQFSVESDAPGDVEALRVRVFVCARDAGDCAESADVEYQVTLQRPLFAGVSSRVFIAPEGSGCANRREFGAPDHVLPPADEPVTTHCVDSCAIRPEDACRSGAWEAERGWCVEDEASGELVHACDGTPAVPCSP